MGLTELFLPVYNCEGIKKFNLEEKAVKLLQKYVESLDSYLSLNAAKKNFKSITSQDAFIIVSELERIGYLIGKIDKGRMVFKFNNTSERSKISVPLSDIEYAQKRYEERLAKKVERAAKTIERYKNLSSLIEIKDKETSDRENLFDVSLLPVENEAVMLTEKLKQSKSRTALEIHEQDHKFKIDPNCRFCAMEQDKAIGF